MKNLVINTLWYIITLITQFCDTKYPFLKSSAWQTTLHTKKKKKKKKKNKKKKKKKKKHTHIYIMRNNFYDNIIQNIYL